MSLRSLIWGQSSNAIHTCIDALNKYDTMQEASAGLKLLTLIHGLMFNIQEQIYEFLSVHLAKQQFYLFMQDKNVTITDYYVQFNNLSKVLGACGANLRKDEGIM